jgi:hypothetical protein
MATTLARDPVVMSQAAGASMSAPAMPPPPTVLRPVLNSPQRLGNEGSFGLASTRST